MNTFQAFEELFGKLNRAEKARVLQWAAQDVGGAFPGIDINPVVSGGEPGIFRTRIPVWILVQARNLGMSEAEILISYPSLRAEDLVNAWSYYRLNKDEIDNQIVENEAA